MRSRRINKLGCIIFTMGLGIFTSVPAASFTIKEPANEVLIFVSFSMPMKSLQAWSAQAQKIHAPLVVRGLLGDSFGETQKAVKRMIGDQNGGVMLDPRLFERYQITQVPAVVVRKKMNNACLSNQSCWYSEVWDRVIGDMGLADALQFIADRGDNVEIAEIAHRWLIAERSS